jgi:hypothetical protein
MQNKIANRNTTEISISNATDLIESIENKCELPTKVFLEDNYSSDKVRVLKGSQIYSESVSMLLIKLITLSGIKSEVDELNSKDIFGYISKACADLTLADIYKAFELERYSVYNEKTQHFGLFNTEYFGTVIKKYREWRISEMKRLNISPPKKELTVTAADLEKTRDEFLKIIFDEITVRDISYEAYHLYKDLEFKINATVEDKRLIYKEQLRIYEVEEKSFIRNKYGLMSKSHLDYLSNQITSKTPLNIVQNRSMSILASKYLSKFIADFETFKKEINESNVKS